MSKKGVWPRSTRYLTNNGDRLGTPADFFEGTQAVTQAEGATEIDGPPRGEAYRAT